MKRLVFIVYTLSSFLFSLMVATNLFAHIIHYAHVLGHPQLGRWYEPFHLIYWYFTIRAPGNQYQISFISFLVSFVLLSFVGFRLYTRLRLNIQGIYGSSRWLMTRELRKQGAFAGQGVVLGQSKEARFHKNHKGQYRMTRAGKIIFDDAHTHVAVIAPTRGGKGVSCVVPTLLSWTHSVVVNDPKKENYSLTSSWRDKFSHVYCFEPTSSESAKFNPLNEISPPPRDVMDAQNIAEIVTHPHGDSDYDNLHESPHWVNAAKQLITGAILYVVHEPTERDKSLHGVASLLQSPDMSIGDVLGMMLQSSHPAVSETARNMLNKADEDQSGVLSTACDFLSLYQDPVVSYNTSYSDFSIRDLTNGEHPVSLYICTNPESQERLKPLIRLMVQLIAKKLTGDLSFNRRPILFLLDEFISLGRFSFLQDWLAYCAQYRIKCMLIAQSFNAIYEKYGERSSILNNCHTKAILGAGEPQDAKVVVDYLGSYSINKKNVSQQSTLGNIVARSRSNSYIETERKLMTVDEVLRLPYEEFILLTSGQHPYRGKKIMYFTDRRFIDRTNPKTNKPLAASRRERLGQLPRYRLQLPWYTDWHVAELREIYELPTEESQQAYAQRMNRSSQKKLTNPGSEAQSDKPESRESPIDQGVVPVEFDTVTKGESESSGFSASDLIREDDI